MGSTRNGWTLDRIQILREGWAQGLSATKIANKLGHVTRNAVIGKAHRLGLPNRAIKDLPFSSEDPIEPPNFLERDIRRIANEAAEHVGATSHATRNRVVSAVTFALRQVMSCDYVQPSAIDVEAVYEKLKAARVASLSAPIGEAAHGG